MILRSESRPAFNRQGFFFGVPLRELLAAFSVFFLLSCLHYYPLLDFNVTMSGPDLALFFIPFRQVWVELLQQGHFPLWEPYTSSGNPIFATIQTAVLYPFSVLYLFLDFFAAFNLNLILHYALAGFFMYWLLRATACSRLGSVLGALVFMFGGYLFSIRFYLSTLLPVVWTPLLLLCFFGGWQRRDFRFALLASVVAVFMFFAGGVETVYQVFAWLVLFSLFPRLLFSTDELWGLKQRLGYLAGFLIFFSGLSAVQFWPTLELIQNSMRSDGYAFDYATRWSLQSRDWFQFVLPDPYGAIAPDAPAGAGQTWLQSLYVGLIPMVLSAFYFVQGGRRAWTLFLVMAVSVALALGAASPLYVLFFEILPWFDSFRYPVKFIMPLVFALALASAWGWDRLRGLEHASRSRFGILVAATSCMMGFGAVDFYFDDLAAWMTQSGFGRPFYNRSGINLKNFERLLGFAALFFLFLYFALGAGKRKRLWAGLAVFVFFLDIFFSTQGSYQVVGKHYYTDIPPTTRFLMGDKELFRVYVTPESENMEAGSEQRRYFRGVRIHASGIPVEFRNQARVQQLRGWNVIGKKRQVLFLRTLHRLSNTKRLPLLRMANVKYIVHSGKEPLDTLPIAFMEPEEYRRELEQKFDYPPPLLRVYENPGYLGRAFLAGGCKALPDGPALKQALLDARWNPRRWVFLPESPAEFPCAGSQADNEEGAGTVEPLAVEPDGYVFAVASARRQFLVLSDSYYPGWEAEVDGVPVPIHRANMAFRAVVVPEGKHTVEFRYRPDSFYYGAGVSAFTLVAGSVFVAAATRRRREILE